MYLTNQEPIPGARVRYENRYDLPAWREPATVVGPYTAGDFWVGADHVVIKNAAGQTLAVHIRTIEPVAAGELRFKVGDRVQFLEPWDIFPIMIVQPGTTGTVVASSAWFAVRLDETIPALAEWENCINAVDGEEIEGLSAVLELA